MSHSKQTESVRRTQDLRRKARGLTLEWIPATRPSSSRSRRGGLPQSGDQGPSLALSLCVRDNGFTFIEILIVVVLIGIAAMIVVPMMSSAASMQIRSAANMITADLEYAKSMAISRGQNFSVVFDKSTESYRIENQDGDIIAHPVKKGFDYAIDFQSDSRLNRVDIVDVDFEPGSNQTITFDYLGSPYSGTGISNPLNSGSIELQAGEFSKTISIEPVTGYISITE